jgi:magnesium transporter
MPFVSEILGKLVTDRDGVIVGTLKDLVARCWKEFPHPVIEAIVVEHKGETFFLPYSSVAALISPAIPLRSYLENIQPFSAGDEDIFLVRDVFDKQIIDTNGARVVRVNDLELVRVNGTLLVSNVDIGSMGILRRIGMAKLAQNLALHLNLHVHPNYISWDNVELLRPDQSMRLRVPREKITELHPADIADIISDLNRLERGKLLATLDVDQLADTLEEIEPDFQASLLQEMSDEKAADVLEEMAPDEAADLLAEFSKERSEELLDLMEADEADDVRKLLTYPVDSAGGIMTTEFASIRPGLTAEQAIQALRKTAGDAETFFYVYVTDEQYCLIGVFSLDRLILVEPDTPIEKIMSTRVISVRPFEKQNKVAQLIAKYDLLAVPVVDENNHMQGIVTSDDALDKIIPTAWKKRLPRFYH